MKSADYFCSRLIVQTVWQREWDNDRQTDDRITSALVEVLTSDIAKSGRAVFYYATT